jgi:hypothetical protein
MAIRQNTFLLKRSNVPYKIPPLSGLTLGELALNTADAKLYTLFTSGTTGATEVREIGWNRISRTGDTVTGNFNFNGDISISGSSQPSGYVLSVTGDTNFKGNVNVQGNLIISGGTQSIFSGNSSSDLVRITQVGTGRAFVVEDSANPDFTPFQINNQGNVGVGQSLIISSYYSSTTVNAFLEINSTLSSRDYGIYQAGPVISLPSYGVFGNAQQIGVWGTLASDGGGIGVYGQTGNAGGESQSGDYIGGKFESFTSGGNRYSLQLLDGTEGVGKFLYSVTSDGKANWTSQLSGTSLTINGDSIITGSTYTKNLIVTGGTQSIFSGNSSTELVRITQTGSGDAFVVEDSANADISHFVIDANGNTAIGLTTPRQKLDVSGNTIVSGTISGGTMVITTQPTSGYTTTQILMRNSTTGQVEITDSTSPSIYNYGMTYVMTTFNYLT